MTSARSLSPSTSTSKRLRRSSTPASAICSRTSTLTFVGRERRSDRDAPLELDTGGGEAVLHGGEGSRDVEQVEVADVADPEDLALPLALAADQLHAEPVAQVEQERVDVERVRRAHRRDDGGAVLVRRGELEAHRLDPGPGRTAEADVALEGRLEPLGEDEAERDVEPEDERDG